MAARDRGQSTVEFAVVALVLLAVAIGVGAVADYLARGSAVEAANENAAYGLEVSADGARYLLMF